METEYTVVPKGDPADKIDQVAGTKPKKHLPKKAKLAIIISTIVLAIAGIVAALVLFVFKHEEPEVVLSDRDILVSHAWEKEDAPTVIWTFRTDGTGEITTNKSNYYNMTWELSQGEETNTLSITTEWLYKLEDTFTFSLDRENNSFAIKNLADETESTFVPLGTAEKAEKENSSSEDITEVTTE